jgi:ribonuclease HI
MEQSYFFSERANGADGAQVVRVEFDGGSTCNIPRLGYGKGYGSYRIGEGAVRRVRFEGAMSANCAEILTLVAAITEAKRQGARKLLVVGDSQIALKWANVAAGKRKATKVGNTSDGFQKAVVLLYQVARDTKIVTQWQPREHSFNTFGH